jgi:DNA repair protein RecO (recombination protein O)
MPLSTTKGIVFHYFRYGETSIIAKVYTEKFGLQAYLVKGLRSKKSTLRAGLFQPGSLVEMVVYKNEKSSLQYIREIKSSHLFTTIPYDIKKSSILLFICEILTKAIRGEAPDQEMFSFLYQSLLFLDQTEHPVGNIHLVFLIKLTRYLGFFPRENRSERTPFFNLAEGVFQSQTTLPGPCLDHAFSKQFGILLQASFEEAGELGFSPSSRNELLEAIIQYYRLHLPVIKEIHSHHVLKEVLA